MIPPRGNPHAPIAIVGEQPGRTEVRLNEPFVGPAGENLRECLRQAGINIQDTYRTNVIKDLDLPLAEYVTFKSGKGIFTAKGEYYLNLLREELSCTTANILIACGNVALWALTSRIGITSWRGSVVESTLLSGRKVLPTLHPATWTQEKLYRNPEALYNKYLVTHDLLRAKEESQYPEIRRIPRTLHTEPTYAQVMEFLRRCAHHMENGGVLDYDIEIQPNTHEISCIGLALGAYEAMCIPFTHGEGNYFSPPQELTIIETIDTLFSNPHYAKRGQNVIFDAHLLLHNYGIRSHNLHDTMIAQGILCPELPKSLAFITSIWTDIPYYKQDGKIWLGGGNSWKAGWEYNALDVISCADAHPKQLVALQRQGNLATYDRQRRLIEPLTYMMAHGIRVNVARMAEEYTKCLTECQNVKFIFDERTKGVNIQSTPQLVKLFYETLGHQPYLNPETQRPTVDALALRKLSAKGIPEAQAVLKYRHLKKLASTFLDTSKIDPDGRIRCSYNPVGTRYGRISSSENIFGSGTNLQNVPHSVLRFFIADEGYVIYSLDMSQIENRLVAYVGNIPSMIHAFENHIDLHRLTAQRVLSLLLKEERTLDSITPDERKDYGKVPNHAFNYGLGYKSFATRHEITEGEARKIYTAYHTAYPELRSSFWRSIETQLKKERKLVNLFGRVIPFLGDIREANVLHEAYSAIPQSTCGDLVNERGLCYAYYNQHPLFERVELLTQVHDSIEIQIPLDLGWDNHAVILSMLRESLEAKLQYKDHTFSIPVDITMSLSLCKEEGIELPRENFQLSTIYEKLQNAIHQQ